MKKYIKPALYMEEMSISAVITTPCVDNVAEMPKGSITGTEGDVYTGYVDQYGNIVLADRVPCAIMSGGVVGPDFTGDMPDCFSKYECYHNPDADWNTVFGGS